MILRAPAALAPPALAALLTLTGCPSCPAETPPAPAAPPAGAVSSARAAIRPLDSEAPGISGMALDAGGELWVVPERRRQLIPLRMDGSVVARPLAIAGLPEGVDTESLAWLEGEPRRVAMGLESPRSGGGVTLGGEGCDVGLFELEPAKHRVVLRRCLAFPYKAMGITPAPNHGIEGLCRAGPHLVAALETPRERGGRRLSPMAVYQLLQERWRSFDLALTSDAEQKGKISALECRLGSKGELELWAVERHFKVGRLLRFSLPTAASPAAPVTPAVVLDLQRLLPSKPNFEGLALLPGRRMVLVNDNHFGRRHGESMLVFVQLK